MCGSLVPRFAITANTVEGLVNLLHRMMSGGCLEAWHFQWTAVDVHTQHVSHAYKRTPDVTLRRSLPGLPHVPSSCMETGLLIVKANLKKGGPIMLSLT